MKELQPQRLNGSVCLKAQTGQELFPEAGHQSTLVKTFPASGLCGVKAGRSTEQGAESGQRGNESRAVPGVLEATSRDPPWPGSGRVLLKPPGDGSAIPPSSGFSAGRGSQDFHVGRSRVSAAKSWELEHHRDDFKFSQPEVEQIPNPSSPQGRESSVVQFPHSIQILLADVFEALCTLQDYSNPKYLSSAHYPNKCLHVFIFFISLRQLQGWILHCVKEYSPLPGLNVLRIHSTEKKED